MYQNPSQIFVSKLDKIIEFRLHIGVAKAPISEVRKSLIKWTLNFSFSDYSLEFNSLAHREPPKRALSGLAESQRGGDAVQRRVRRLRVGVSGNPFFAVSLGSRLLLSSSAALRVHGEFPRACVLHRCLLPNLTVRLIRSKSLRANATCSTVANCAAGRNRVAAKS
jgi:hypothetical protein